MGQDRRVPGKVLTWVLNGCSLVRGEIVTVKVWNETTMGRGRVEKISTVWNKDGAEPEKK